MVSDYQPIAGDCLTWLRENQERVIHLSFVDPPFNQGKTYRHAQDDLPNAQYWQWMKDVLSAIYQRTEIGGAVYFMQREKNAEMVLNVLRESGWCFQNLIIWKKKTSAVPSTLRYGKQYQIIVYATKGERPRVFNRLRISPPLPPGYQYERENGIYVTDIWDDIRELTSGYFAGDEAIRNEQGDRFHKQQAPIALLLRIILSSTRVGDTVLDPFAGTGTTLVVAHQLARNSLGLDLDPENINCIKNRLKEPRTADAIAKYYSLYSCTENLVDIWQGETSDRVSAER
jgi:site-specific DNA-methyltransferase (adenine-specific)